MGQEAVAVGVCDALHKDDRVIGNHRSHGHYLAKGGSLKKMVCELFGKECGSSHGKGGSMHLIDTSVNFIGSTPILSSAVPLSCGSAFEQMYHKKDAITVVFLGDGAFEEGGIYESLNLAALFKLPLLFVLENNFRSINTRLWERRSQDHNTEKIVTGFGVHYMRSDGNNYLDVVAKASELITKVRTGKPALIECLTYRHMAHSGPSFEEETREEDTIEQRKEKDPVAMMRRETLASGVSEDEINTTEEDIKKIVIGAIVFAEKAPFPRKESLYTDLYV
ncbi:MAG: thiamine pyrophosphate-dependent dehydrogenase E1 component subunit alpha [Dethiobacter sp.]